MKSHRDAFEIANELSRVDLVMLSGLAHERIEEYERLTLGAADDDYAGDCRAAQEVWVAALGRYEAAIAIVTLTEQRHAAYATDLTSDDVPF